MHGRDRVGTVAAIQPITGRALPPSRHPRSAEPGRPAVTAVLDLALTLTHTLALTLTLTLALVVGELEPLRVLDDIPIS